MGKTLRHILADSQVIATQGDFAVPITGVHHDSREIEPGHLFCAIDGNRARGLDYADMAVEKGAAAVLAQGELPDVPVPSAQVAHVRRTMALAACELADHPTGKVSTVGLTGTNGKTTTCAIIEAGLKAVGIKAGVIGTLNGRLDDQRWAAPLTTPEAPALQGLAKEMVDRGADALVMEVSSHGLELHRAFGTRYRVVAFTNLSQDHLDFHGSMEAYGKAKLKLFSEDLAFSPGAVAVVNMDDPFGVEVADACRCPVVGVSAMGDESCPVRLSSCRCTLEGLEAICTVEDRQIPIRSALVGEHNAANVVLALGIIYALYPDKISEAAQGIGSLSSVPGRLERVADPRGTAVFVDYAHTPDALRHVVGVLKKLTTGRLLVVFGCGGDRDQSKRPLMGAEAARGGLAIVTSDNPRTEDPLAIIDMAAEGVKREQLPQLTLADVAQAERGYSIEPDRRTAIRGALSAARADDVVLIAGKGHEPYQILGEEKIHFDDREEAMEAILLASKGGARS